MPLSLGERSDPEPDLAIVTGTPRDHSPARLADYWIINLPDRQIEVYRRPMPDADAFADWRYADCTIAHVGDTLTPLAAPMARVTVADLLP